MYFWSGCQCCNNIHLHLDQTPMENTYPQWWCLPPGKAGNCLQPQATGGLRGLKNIHLWQWRCAEFAVTVGETCVPCGSHRILAGACTILIKNQQQCWTFVFLSLEHTAFRDCSSGVDSWHLHKTKFLSCAPVSSNFLRMHHTLCYDANVSQVSD